MDQGKWATGIMKKLEQGQLVFHLFIDREGSPVRVVCNTSQSVVPSQECREQGEKAGGLDDRRVWRIHSVTM